jgi:hypothetical protein
MKRAGSAVELRSAPKAYHAASAARNGAAIDAGERFDFG